MVCRAKKHQGTGGLLSKRQQQQKTKKTHNPHSDSSVSDLDSEMGMVEWKSTLPTGEGSESWD